MEFSAYAFIGLTGQEVSRFELPWRAKHPRRNRFTWKARLLKRIVSVT